MLSIKAPGDLQRLILAVFVLAICLAVIGYLSFVVDPSSMRFVSAEAALTLLFIIFSILALHVNGMVIVNKVIDIIIAGLFFSIIVVTQHRSVFLACSLGLLLIFWLYRKKTTFLVKALIASIVILTVMGAVLINTPRFEHSLMKSLVGITNPGSDRTGSWRIAAWHEQLDKASAEELVYGKGLGSYYRWFYKGYEIKISPHNAYVEMISKFGVLGLVIYGLLVLSFFRKMFVVRKKLPPGPMRAYVEMSILSFGSAHAYMSGYGFPMIVLIFYAIGISTARLLQDFEEVAVQHEQGPPGN
jgi:O-antigen ligase